jgi:hypothetical protein
VKCSVNLMGKGISMSLSRIAFLLKKSSLPGWNTFIDERYEGGHKKVPNPNHETVDRYPQVTAYVALKNEGFRKHVEEEYHQWMESKETPEMKTNPHRKLFGGHTTESIMEKHGDFIKSVKIDSADSLSYVNLKKENIQSKIVSLHHWIEVGQKQIDSETDIDYKRSLKKMLNSRLNQIVRYTDISNEIDNLDPTLIKGLSNYSRDLNPTMVQVLAHWQGSSYSLSSSCLQDFLSKSNVAGTSDMYDNKPEDHIQKFGLPKDYQESIEETYAYQQAVFKHLGVKEVTLYRGVEIDPTEGKVRVASRPLASWSSNPAVASRFGTQIVKCVVPIHKILLSPIIAKSMDGDSRLDESEYAVMGSSELECDLFSINTR